MTDTTTRLPDLIIRTTASGDRFGWRFVTMDDERFLTSMEQSEKDGSPADYETRAEARQAAGRHLLALVENQPDVAGEVVSMPSTARSARFAA